MRVGPSGLAAGLTRPRTDVARSRGLLTRGLSFFLTTHLNPLVNRRATKSSRSVSLGHARGIRTHSSQRHIAPPVNSANAENPGA